MDHPGEREKCSRKSWLPWRRGWPSQRTWSRGRGQQHADQTNINGMISMLTSSSGNRRRAMRASCPKTYVSLCKDVRSLFVNASRNLRISLRHVFGLGGHSGARGFISAQGCRQARISGYQRKDTQHAEFSTCRLSSRCHLSETYG